MGNADSDPVGDGREVVYGRTLAYASSIGSSTTRTRSTFKIHRNKQFWVLLKKSSHSADIGTTFEDLIPVSTQEEVGHEHV